MNKSSIDNPPFVSLHYGTFISLDPESFMNVRYDGRELQVVFEGRTNRSKPRSVRNASMQARLRESLEQVAPDMEPYDMVVSSWLPGDHPPGHEGGYCQYSDRTLHLEDVNEPDDPIVWNRLIETALHELAHLIHGPSNDPHGPAWVQVCARLLAIAHQCRVYDYQLAQQHSMAGSDAYRSDLIEQVECLVSNASLSDHP